MLALDTRTKASFLSLIKFLNALGLSKSILCHMIKIIKLRNLTNIQEFIIINDKDAEEAAEKEATN
jgi:hypothetical protein